MDQVLEAWDGPTEVGDTPEIMKTQEDFLLKFLADRKITHFFSGEFYGDHVSRALGAEDCRVDEARSVVPISGTAIRNDPFVNRQFIPQEVYRDMVAKVVFLGAPSTGKTSLAESLAKELNTLWMPEYGREYWDKYHKDRRLTLEQLVEIAEGHVQREDTMALDANRFLFVDTDATTTYMFSLYYHGKAHPRLKELADNARSRYDLFFLCGDDIPYDDTWDRSGHANRAVFQKKVRTDILRRRIPFIDLTGSLKARVQTVTQMLQDFDKFDSVCNNLRKNEKANQRVERTRNPRSPTE
jgi:HTH-type transcriptional repressor of NAD biosynthesis genes